jgi:hypothetical protein
MDITGRRLHDHPLADAQLHGAQGCVRIPWSPFSSSILEVLAVH